MPPPIGMELDTISVGPPRVDRHPRCDIVRERDALATSPEESVVHPASRDRRKPISCRRQCEEGLDSQRARPQALLQFGE